MLISPHRPKTHKSSPSGPLVCNLFWSYGRFQSCDFCEFCSSGKKMPFTRTVILFDTPGQTLTAFLLFHNSVRQNGTWIKKLHYTGITLFKPAAVVLLDIHNKYYYYNYHYLYISHISIKVYSSHYFMAVSLSLTLFLSTPLQQNNAKFSFSCIRWLQKIQTKSQSDCDRSLGPHIQDSQHFLLDSSTAGGEHR